MRKSNLFIKNIEKDKKKEIEVNSIAGYNLNQIKSKISDKEFKNFNNWENIKSKQIMIKHKKKKLEKLFKITNFLVSSLCNNLIFNEMFVKNLYKDEKIKKKTNNVYNVYKKYIEINLIKIFKKKNIKNKDKKNFIIFILDFRSLKFKIVAFNNFGCLKTVTNGLIFKKLGFNSKKYKKSEKLIYLSIKSILINFNFAKKYKKIYINTKGLNKNIKNVVNYTIKKINKNNLSILSENKISRNIFFKFKKIKAIKRKLKKKIIKFG